MAKDKEKGSKKADRPADKADKVEKTDKAEKASAKVEKVEKVEASPKKAKADPGHADEKAAARSKAKGHDHAHAPAAGHHPVNRKQYWVIFVVLFVLTVLEVGVAQVPGISRTLLAILLIGMALAKAACVGLYYMHLNHETKILRWGVMIPFSAPALYAFVLIAEGAWRLARW